MSGSSSAASSSPTRATARSGRSRVPVAPSSTPRTRPETCSETSAHNLHESSPRSDGERSYARYVTSDGPARILVVEDDRVINQAVADRLGGEGYDVVQAYDGPDAVARFGDSEPDLVLLDVMLPGFDGHEVCRRIQAVRPVPVLMLTARDDEADILVGLGVGADDYLTKPFRMRELVARVAALLRRVERAAELATRAATDLGDLRIDPGARRVWVTDTEVHLTPTEFDLLLCLA